MLRITIISFPYPLLSLKELLSIAYFDGTLFLNDFRINPFPLSPFSLLLKCLSESFLSHSQKGHGLFGGYELPIYSQLLRGRFLALRILPQSRGIRSRQVFPGPEPQYLISSLAQSERTNVCRDNLVIE